MSLWLRFGPQRTGIAEALEPVGREERRRLLAEAPGFVFELVRCRERRTLARIAALSPEALRHPGLLEYAERQRGKMERVLALLRSALSRNTPSEPLRS